MGETTADAESKRQWYQFHLSHLFVVVTMVAVTCACLKYFCDFRIARANLYDAIMCNELSEVKELLNRHPSLIRTNSPTLRVPGDFSIHTFGETPISVAVMYEARDTFDYLLSRSPDINASTKRD